MRGGRRLKWYKSFRTKSLFILFLIMVLLISLVLFIITKKIRTDTELQVYDNNMSVALTLTETFDMYFSELKTNMEVLSYTDEIQNFDFEKTDKFLQTVITKHSSIIQIYLMDKQGNQFYKTSELDTLGSRLDREYFKEAIQGETNISDVIVSRSTDKPITVIAVPIYSQNRVVGVLGASIDFSTIASVIGKYNLDQSGYAYIVDKDGKIITHPNSDFVDQMLDISYLDPVQALMAGEDGIGKYNFDDETKLVAYVKMNETEWGVLVQVPTSEAFRKIDEIERWLSVLLGVAIVGVIISSIFMSNYFMRPVNEIVGVIDRISENRKTTYFDTDRDDEFGLIEKAIDRMMSELNSIHDSLEEKVQMRTNQLTLTNSNLEVSQNELININVTLTDKINELKETQERLVKAEKISALARVAVRLSHQLNTPLGTCITTTSFLMKKTLALEEILSHKSLKENELKEYLHEVVNGTDILLGQLKKSDEMIKQFRDVPLEHYKGEKQQVNLYKEINNAKETYVNSFDCPNYNIELNCPTNLTFKMWQGVFGEVFHYLFDNSFEHGCNIDKSFKITIDVIELSDIIEIRYSDNGMGIRPEVLEYIFEPLSKNSMSGSGTGMGLNKVFNIVKNILDGEINCESDIGLGTKIIISMPK